MARGHPDYIKSVGYTPEGLFLQEYALPPIWFKDDFESPECKWAADAGTAEVMTEAGIAADIAFPYNGSGMLVLEATAGLIFQVRRHIGTPPQTTNLGFSMFFGITSETDWQDIVNSCVLIFGEFRNGTTQDTFEITYNPRTYNWYYNNSIGVRTLLGNLRICSASWHYIKLIINPILKEYRSLQVDWRTFDMSGIPYESVGNLLCTRYYLHFYGNADVGDDVTMVVDDFTVTYGES